MFLTTVKTVKEASCHGNYSSAAWQDRLPSQDLGENSSVVVIVVIVFVVQLLIFEGLGCC